MSGQVEGVIQETMKKVNATWTVRLLTVCPYCNEVVNPLRTDDYRHDWVHFFGSPLEKRKQVNIEVECPKCHLKFIVEDTK